MKKPVLITAFAKCGVPPSFQSGFIDCWPSLWHNGYVVRTFFTTLAALLVAMAIAFGFWKHEEWVRAKNEWLNAIRFAYEDANSSTSNSLEALTAARRDEVMAARRLVEIFNAKRLPLSSQDKRDFPSATKIVEEWDSDQEQHDLKLGIMNAETKISTFKVVKRFSRAHLTKRWSEPLTGAKRS
jgi:hypothetical protein